MKRFKFLRVCCVFALLSAFAIAGEKQCEVKDFDEENYTWEKICFYPKQTLLEAYADFRASEIKDDSDSSEGYDKLRKKLEIGKNYDDEFEYLSISYKWENDKKFSVNMFYSGGDTTIKFAQANNGTTITVIYAPD